MKDLDNDAVVRFKNPAQYVVDNSGHRYGLNAVDGYIIYNYDGLTITIDPEEWKDLKIFGSGMIDKSTLDDLYIIKEKLKQENRFYPLKREVLQNLPPENIVLQYFDKDPFAHGANSACLVAWDKEEDSIKPINKYIIYPNGNVVKKTDRDHYRYNYKKGTTKELKEYVWKIVISLVESGEFEIVFKEEKEKD